MIALRETTRELRMTSLNPNKNYLMIEDDDDHAELIRISMESNGGSNRIDRVSNGVEAISYLNRAGEYADAPRPDVILLDLNMPLKNGHEVIEVVKNDDDLKMIPIIVLTTSNAEQDRVRAYQSNVNSYVVKPVEFAQFKQLVCDIDQFWSRWNQTPFCSDASQDQSRDSGKPF